MSSRELRGGARKIVAFEFDGGAQAEGFVIEAVGGENAIDDSGGAIQVIGIHGFAHLLQVRRGHLVLVVRVLRLRAREGRVHGDAVVGLEAGDGVVQGAVL